MTTDESRADTSTQLARVTSAASTVLANSRLREDRRALVDWMSAILAILVPISAAVVVGAILYHLGGRYESTWVVQSTGTLELLMVGLGVAIAMGIIVGTVGGVGSNWLCNRAAPSGDRDESREVSMVALVAVVIAIAVVTIVLAVLALRQLGVLWDVLLGALGVIGAVIVLDFVKSSEHLLRPLKSVLRKK